jgi:hypothetical protein
LIHIQRHTFFGRYDCTTYLGYFAAVHIPDVVNIDSYNKRLVIKAFTGTFASDKQLFIGGADIVLCLSFGPARVKVRVVEATVSSVVRLRTHVEYDSPKPNS